jgi:hypothetical protein
MGYTGPIPDRWLRIMDRKDRPKGKAGKTIEELAHHREVTSEREQQKLFWNYCLLKDVLVDPHRFGKRTTNKPGWPDFPCYKNGRVLFIEFKSPSGRLSEAQKQVKAELERQGFRYVVVILASDAIEIVNQWLLNL